MDPPSELVAALEAWAVELGLPPSAGRQVLRVCPWLDGQDTVSNALAPQLFEEALSGVGLDGSASDSLCDAYNACVERDYRASLPAREDACAAMRAALSVHGEGLYPPASFWIVDDSLSGSMPWIIVRDPALRSEALVSEVARAAAGCPHFTAVAFSDEAGDCVREVPLSR